MNRETIEPGADPAQRGAFEIVRRRSSAADFHALAIPDEPRPELWVLDVTRPALVLGSTQALDAVDADACARRGIDVVRRRSGGGAVLVMPGTTTWVDLILPAGGPGWSPDIHRPMVWLGQHLAAAFHAVGDDDVAVHDGAIVDTAHSRLVCFDGVGPGELVRSDGAKVVGISQRRTRAAARLQCCWYSDYAPTLLPALLRNGPDPTELRAVATNPAERAAGVVAELSVRLGSDPSSMQSGRTNVPSR